MAFSYTGTFSYAWRTLSSVDPSLESSSASAHCWHPVFKRWPRLRVSLYIRRFWKRVRIFDRHRVELSVVHTEPELSTFLQDEQYWCTPFTLSRLNYFHFQLFLDFCFFWLSCFWSCSVRCWFESFCTWNQVYRMFCNRKFSKFTEPHTFMFLQHLPDFLMVLSWDLFQWYIFCSHLLFYRFFFRLLKFRKVLIYSRDIFIFSIDLPFLILFFVVSSTIHSMSAWVNSLYLIHLGCALTVASFVPA